MIFKVRTSERGRGSISGDPARPWSIKHQILNIALICAEEKAEVLDVVACLSWHVVAVAVVTTSLVVVASLDTALEA